MVADDIRIDGNKVSFSLVFEKPTDPFAKSLVKAAEAALKTFVGEFVEPTVSMTFLKQTPAAVKNVLPGVKNIIGVSSGKGGVGKPGVCQAALLHRQQPCRPADQPVFRRRQHCPPGLHHQHLYPGGDHRLLSAAGRLLYLSDESGQPAGGNSCRSQYFSAALQRTAPDPEAVPDSDEGPLSVPLLQILFRADVSIL